MGLQWLPESGHSLKQSFNWILAPFKYWRSKETKRFNALNKMAQSTYSQWSIYSQRIHVSNKCMLNLGYRFSTRLLLVTMPVFLPTVSPHRGKPTGTLHNKLFKYPADYYLNIIVYEVNYPSYISTFLKVVIGYILII